ncbi:MAG: NAD-binding protein, partial [Candidatus Poribacteria bacterium]|nr:NAD-binding protein [Candidatus Poribacteria bacterium]
MKVIIVGAGEMGYHTAKVLTAEHHDVIVIDESTASLNRVAEHFDLLTLQGSGASMRLLMQAGLPEADLLIALTNDDEINMLACFAAAKHGVETKVARVSSPDYFHDPKTFAPGDVGIDLYVSPERLCADEFMRLLRTPEAREIVDFALGKVRLIAFNVGKG